MKTLNENKTEKLNFIFSKIKIHQKRLKLFNPEIGCCQMLLLPEVHTKFGLLLRFLLLIRTPPHLPLEHPLPFTFTLILPLILVFRFPRPLFPPQLVFLLPLPLLFLPHPQFVFLLPLPFLGGLWILNRRKLGAWSLFDLPQFTLLHFHLYFLACIESSGCWNLEIPSHIVHNCNYNCSHHSLGSFCPVDLPDSRNTHNSHSSKFVLETCFLKKLFNLKYLF